MHGAGRLKRTARRPGGPCSAPVSYTHLDVYKRQDLYPVYASLAANINVIAEGHELDPTSLDTNVREGVVQATVCLLYTSGSCGPIALMPRLKGMA